jgi:Lon protease-like protein
VSGEKPAATRSVCSLSPLNSQYILSVTTRLPIFPLQVVLFPNVQLPLHIFEERYRILIGRCISESKPFGVVCHRGETIKRVGCAAAVSRVIQTYDDGSLDIIALGRERFVIDKIDDSGMYLEADVHFLRDAAEAGGDNGDLVDRAVEELLTYGRFTRIPLDREVLSKLTADQLSFLIAGIDVFGLETKQELLELGPAGRRLQWAVARLARVNSRLASERHLRTALNRTVDIDSFTN